MEQRKGKIITGIVVSTKMQNTVVVEVVRMFRHPKYKKQVKRTRRFFAHNPDMTLAVGEMVRIQETKPISKRTHFIVLEKVKL